MRHLLDSVGLVWCGGGVVVVRGVSPVLVRGFGSVRWLGVVEGKDGGGGGGGLWLAR